MHPSFVQPHSSAITERVVRSILRSNPDLRREARAFSIENRAYHSNDFAEVRLADRRTLIVKRGRYHWSHQRFGAARLAARLIRTRTSLLAPESIESPPGEVAVDVYWRLDYPTMADRWPSLKSEQRRSAMLSAGQALRSIHAIQLSGHGELHRATEHPDRLAEVLTNDLEGRLLPASRSIWPQAVPVIRELARLAPVVGRLAPPRGVLLHGDPHLANLLCGEGGEAHCVGVLDLEDSAGGPGESDLARMAVLHTQLFQRALEGDWLTNVLEGYGGGVDPFIFHFYCAYHTVNLGFHSAAIGHDVHAADVAIAASHLVTGLGAEPRELTCRLPDPR